MGYNSGYEWAGCKQIEEEFFTNNPAEGANKRLFICTGWLHCTLVSTGSAHDLALSTVNGSMLAGHADENADLQGRNIDLVVAGGSIGSTSNYLDFYFVLLQNPTSRK